MNMKGTRNCVQTYPCQGVGKDRAGEQRSRLFEKFVTVFRAWSLGFSEIPHHPKSHKP